MLKKKALIASVLCAVASVGFVAGVSAEETMNGTLDEVVVEASKDVLPGGYVATSGSVGILGDKDVMKTPFSVTNVSEKTLDLYLGPNEPLDKALVGVPSVRASGSVLHGDFSVRGFRYNGTAMYVNGVHGVMTQFNLPMFAMEGIDVVSGPNSMLGASGVQYESTTAGGIINARTKKAGDKDFVKYKQTFSGKGSFGEYLDISQRLGKDRAWGVRLNTELLNGETAVDDANMKAKGIALNVDHKDEHSSTNFFINYRDLDVYNGIRWFKLANAGEYPTDKKTGNPTIKNGAGDGVTGNIPGVTHLPSAPDGGKNYSAAGTWKAGYGWFATLNHEQYMNENWTLFANFGYSRQKLNQNMSPNMSSYWIKDDFGDYDYLQTNSATPQRSYYAQFGTKNKFETGEVKHEVILSVDKAWRNRESGASTGTRLVGVGNIWKGTLWQNWDASIVGYNVRPNNKTSIWGVSLLDSMEFGKWNAMLGIHKHAADARSWSTSTNSYSSVKSDATCPTYSLSYSPEENIMIYGNHAENFDIGASAGDSYENYGQVLPPSKTKQNEVGVKYQNKDTVYTLAYFDIDQASNVSKDVAGFAKPFLVQDGEINHKGLELSVNGKLADKWYGMIGLAYLDAKYKNMGKGNEYKNGVRESGQGKWSGSAAIEYRADDSFSVIGRATYTGSTPFYTVNYNSSTVTKDSKHLEAPAYMVYDLGCSYNTKINNVPVKLTAMCYNLFDKDYWTVARGDQVYLSTPRTFFLSAEFTL